MDSFVWISPHQKEEGWLSYLNQPSNCSLTEVGNRLALPP